MPSGLHNIQTTTSRDLPAGQVQRIYSEKDLKRFWAKVDRGGPTECWEWTGSVSGTGSVKHGQFMLSRQNGQQRNVKAHRVSWELAHGPIPAGVNVCHDCPGGDNPRCVNPAHLFLGSQDDNLKDAARKRRFHRPHTSRAFTPELRLAIFRLPNKKGLVTRLAKQYGVSRAAISCIRRGRFLLRSRVTAAQATQAATRPIASPDLTESREQSKSFALVGKGA